MEMHKARIEAGWITETPVGCVLVVFEDDKLRHIRLNVDDPGSWIIARYPEPEMNTKTIDSFFADLKEFFDTANASIFEKWTISPACYPTPFLKSVYDALIEIKPGYTITYGELAEKSGHPGAARAVGTAMARNPVPIVVPCHRVITSNGCLGGFTGGPDLKRTLLRLEGVEPPAEFN
ncbi:MAG: MGMT family protein [Candidatus Electryonea clarkiae]|nr:MGMT family protein [Candidatus Electryonea clarkiae]